MNGNEPDSERAPGPAAGPPPPPPPPPPPRLGRPTMGGANGAAGADPFRSMRIMRWVMVGLSCVIAIVLLASGSVVLGGLLGALAVMRGISIFTMQRRLAAMRAARAERAGARNERLETWRRQRAGGRRRFPN
jgi:hypothetical protein